MSYTTSCYFCLRAAVEACLTCEGVRQVCSRHRDLYRIEPGKAALASAMDTPWPLRDVVAALVRATDHLLDYHACDTHGHEEFRTAANRGKELLEELKEDSDAS